MKRSSGKNQPDQSMVQYQQSPQYRAQAGFPMQQQMPSQYGPQSGIPMQPPMPPQYGPQSGIPMQPQMPSRYGSPFGQVPFGYGQSYPNVPPMPRQGGPPGMPSSFDGDVYLANLAGISPTDVEYLRMEFYNYTNSSGIIDRTGFQKLYVASLLNKTWDALEREAETAFRVFDVNQTGGLDFSEYMIACARMLRGSSQPFMYSY